jgi:hypothetical protein
MDCGIDSNFAERGGGAYIEQSSPSFTNCTFVRNQTYYDAAGVAVNINSAPSFENCTFFGRGYQYYNPTGISVSNSSLVLSSSIIAHFGGCGVSGYIYPQARIEFCNVFDNGGSFCVSNGPPELGRLLVTNANGDSADIYLNIFEDPMFVDTAADDYHLLPGSPCIDAGDPSLPDDPDSTIADIGAFHFDHTLVISTSILPFGNVPVHDVSTLTTTLHNYTSNPITIRLVVSTDSAFLSDYSPADSILAAHDSLQVGVTFSPDSSRSYSGTLQIQTSYMNKSVTLSGVGVGAYIGSSSTSLDFGAIEPAYPETLSVTLTNRGNSALLLNSLFVNAPYHVASFPSSIAVGDSGRVRIVFNPLSNGLFSDTLLIISSAYNGDSLRIALSGVGELIPAPVQGVVIQVQGVNALLCWEPVVTTIHGNPLTVDAYVIYFAEVSSGPFWYLGMSTDTCFVHDHAVQFADAMFYEVTAYVGNVGLLADIPRGAGREEVEEKMKKNPKSKIQNPNEENRNR